MNCPTCNTELPDVATHCWRCNAYLEDMETSTTDVSPEARNRQKGGDANAGTRLPRRSRGPDVAVESVEESESALRTESPDKRQGPSLGDSPSGSGRGRSSPGTASAGSPTLKDGRTEKQIQTAIKEALDMLGYYVHDMSQDRPTRQVAGIPDLYIQGHGVTAWIEVKRVGGKVSAYQTAFVEREIENGGHACIVFGEVAAAVEYMEELRRRAA